MRPFAASLTAVLVLGALGACGDDDDSATESPVSPAATSTSNAGGGPGSGGAPPGGGGGIGGSCTDNGAAPTAPTAGSVPKKSDAASVGKAVEATNAFLTALGDKKSSALFDFTDLDAKRCSWSNFPDGLFNGRQGARLGDLTESQRSAAMAAVQAVMSAAGYTYVQQELEGDNQLATGANSEYGDDNYHLALYGEPSATEPWTMQFGGHHLAVHVSLGGDVLSVSPYFKGAQPVSYKVDSKTVMPMGDVAEDFFGLFESLSESLLASAKLDGSYDDLVMGPGSDTEYPASAGLAYTELNAKQKQLVQAVIKGYVADYVPELAQPLIDLYETKLDEIKIGWSTSIERESQAYMRIDGPRFWIEWVNTGNPGSSGIHYHTVYRDKLLDYGTGTTAG